MPGPGYQGGVGGRGSTGRAASTWAIGPVSTAGGPSVG